MHSTLNTSRRALSRLADRVRHQDWPESEHRPRFTPLIDVVGDIGRALARPDPDELHAVLPALAALRETLEQDYLDGGIDQSPWKALSHDKAESYAAGALWACSASINSVLTAIEEVERAAAARTGRDAVRRVACELAEANGAVTPGQIREALRSDHVHVDRSTVSKGLGDLLETGDLEPAPPPEGADRRHRYYRRPASAAANHDVDASVNRTVRSLVSSLLAHIDPEDAERIVLEELGSRRPAH